MRKSLLAAVAAAGLLAFPGMAGAEQPADGALTGAATGAIIGAVFGGPIGAAIGAGVGGTVGAAAGDSASRAREEALLDEPGPVTRERRVLRERAAPRVRERTCIEGRTGTRCVDTR